MLLTVQGLQVASGDKLYEYSSTGMDQILHRYKTFSGAYESFDNSQVWSMMIQTTNLLLGENSQIHNSKFALFSYPS